jgi:hypothetical protein
MTKHTKRDQVWSATLFLAKTGRFDLEDVLNKADLDESSRRTARDVLATMTDLGHLEQRSYNGRQHPCWCGSDVDYSDQPGYQEQTRTLDSRLFPGSGEEYTVRTIPWAEESRHSDRDP